MTFGLLKSSIMNFQFLRKIIFVTLFSLRFLRARLKTIIELEMFMKFAQNNNEWHQKHYCFLFAIFNTEERKYFYQGDRWVGVTSLIDCNLGKYYEINDSL